MGGNRDAPRRVTEWALSFLGLGECCGVWSILALSAWSLFYALSFESRPRMQMAILVAIVPIAILGHSTRLTLIWVAG